MVDEIVVKKDELLEVRYDRLFHDLINEKEMKTVEWIVMQILKCKYEDIHGRVRVGNIRLINMSKDDKEKFVDLIVYYKDQIIGIELNNNATGDYLRNALYITNAINNSYISGDSYDKITQGILVNLNWFTDANAKRYKEGVIEEIWTYPSLNKNRPEYFVKFINVNLLSFQDMCYNDVTKENYLWKLFTIKKKNELDDLVEKEKLLIEYRDKLHRLSCNKEYCRMVWDERIEKNLRKREDYLLGISEGIDRGILQKQKEMIMNMHKEKIDINTISKISNMSIDDVEQIINSKDEKQE